jgi:hypothetical protein
MHCRIGAALLRGEWLVAVRLILQGPSGERPEWRAAREAFLHGGDAKVGYRV